MNTHISVELFESPQILRSTITMGRGLAHILNIWQHRARSRTALSRLDQHLLKDIGISPLNAQEEASKPFWEN